MLYSINYWHRKILERGGSEEAMHLFKRFRGREPRVEALLENCGLMQK